jgi:hypothetical protein
MRIIGHRGARGEAPENTLGGFQYIHDLGIRAVILRSSLVTRDPSPKPVVPESPVRV